MTTRERLPSADVILLLVAKSEPVEIRDTTTATRKKAFTCNSSFLDFVLRRTGAARRVVEVVRDVKVEKRNGSVYTNPFEIDRHRFCVKFTLSSRWGPLEAS